MDDTKYSGCHALLAFSYAGSGLITLYSSGRSNCQIEAILLSRPVISGSCAGLSLRRTAAQGNPSHSVRMAANTHRAPRCLGG